MPTASPSAAVGAHSRASTTTASGKARLGDEPAVLRQAARPTGDLEEPERGQHGGRHPEAGIGAHDHADEGAAGGRYPGDEQAAEAEAQYEPT